MLADGWRDELASAYGAVLELAAGLRRDLLDLGPLPRGHHEQSDRRAEEDRCS